MESSVLHKEGESAAAKKQVILLLVAHEFAHFWFGNLVTPKWWSYLWLSEGIATYYEYRISEKIETDWNIEEQFIVDIFQPALAGDSLNSSHPLTYDVHTPEEIESLFDTISYNKGASLLRSVEHFLTKETLHKGLSKYLKEFSHSSADANDLFRVLDKQQKKDKILPADMDVKTILDSWTLQSGYPVIHVQRVDRGIHVVQERFLLERQNDTVGATWWVPISYTKSTNSDFTDTKPKAWLRNQPELMLEENITDTEWIIFNIQATGFYRVNYDPLTWSLITNHLTSPFYRDIHVLNRAQLLDDAFSLSRAGLLNYTTALELSTYLAEEIHLIPWLTYNDIISFINRQLRGTDIYDSFKAYVLTLLNKLYNSLAFQYNTEDSHVMKMIQPTVIEWACTLGSKDCVAKALEMFSKWTENPENYIIPPDIKKAVYCTAARNDNNTWLLLWDQYQHHHSNSDAKWDMYKALGCTEDEDLLKRYLLNAMSKGAEKYMLTTTIDNVISGSPKGVSSILNFLSENFQDAYKVLNDENSFGDTISSIAQGIATHEQAEKLKALLDHNNLSEEAEEGNWIPETMNEDIVWAEKHYDSISNWLRTFLGKTKQIP
jgi:aminopeptidase N